MNKKRLLDKILDNWPAKVICLIIAIFLYFFHQASLIDSKTFVVPLQIIENGMVWEYEKKELFIIIIFIHVCRNFKS